MLRAKASVLTRFARAAKFRPQASGATTWAWMRFRRLGKRLRGACGWARQRSSRNRATVRFFH